MQGQDLRRSAGMDAPRLHRRGRIRGQVQGLVENPEAFWGEEGKRIDWFKPYTRVKNTTSGPARSRSAGSRTAPRTSPTTASTATSRSAATRSRSSGRATTRRVEEDHLSRAAREVCRMANVLRNRGVKKGDRVTIYLPMIPEAAYAMLACARIGAIHSVVFGGFSPDSLAGRIEDCEVEVRHHRRRGPARRPQGAAQGQRRRGDRAGRRGVDHVSSCAAPAAP